MRGISKAEVARCLRSAFEAFDFLELEYREYGPDTVGWCHAQCEVELDVGGSAQINVQGKSTQEVRRRMKRIAEMMGGAGE